MTDLQLSKSEQNQGRPLDVIVLAAGAGTRMKSDLPKVLHKVAGRSMVGWAVGVAQELGARHIVVVTGHGAEAVEREVQQPGVTFARQLRQDGTGDAFKVGAAALNTGAEDTGTKDTGADVLVLYGDTPLLRAETLRDMLAHHRAGEHAMTVLTGVLPDAGSYGRIIRGEGGEVLEIVEKKDATPEQVAIGEFNTGVYLFDERAPKLASQITNANAAGEYYLTDLLRLYRAAGGKVAAYKLEDEDVDDVEGANDRASLSKLEATLQRRLRKHWQAEGVSMPMPETVYIGPDVILARDVTLEMGAVLRGNTRVDTGSVIGAYSVLDDTQVGQHVTVRPHSVLEGAQVGAGSTVGPFARLRSGTVLATGVHVGNFVETKNAELAAGVKAGHLAYLGDVSIGAETNVGAGTIIANFDGVDKHRTEIGAGVFIGSNSTLIAPRKVGDAAFIAASSAVHEDVPEGAMAVARGKQRNVEGWAKRYWRGMGVQRLSQKLPWLAQWLGRQE